MSDETQAPELLPCPFCGEEAHVGGNRRGSFVNCEACMATVPALLETGLSEEEAVEAWNCRIYARTALLASPIVQEIVREERERCIAIAQEHCDKITAEDIAARIRKGEE